MGRVSETSVDIRDESSRRGVVSGHRIPIRATLIEFHVPFSGPDVFRYRSQRWSPNPPRGQITENTVTVSCYVSPDTSDALREETIGDLRNEISRIAEYLAWIAEDVRDWEPRFRSSIESAVENRKSEALAIRRTEAMLGVEIVRDKTIADTYRIPMPARRPELHPRPIQSYPPFEPEPGISEEDYVNIVTDIGNVLAGFERLPVTHIDASEERLRDQIVVSLNAIYGGASAESFSKRGKTDIYLPWESNAVFLAECKWWQGKKRFKTGDLPQLLDRYIVWRDTHTAMVLFVKNKNASAVVSNAIASIREHSRFVKDAASIDRFPTFMLHQDGDKDRQLRLALLPAAIIP